MPVFVICEICAFVHKFLFRRTSSTETRSKVPQYVSSARLWVFAAFPCLARAIAVEYIVVEHWATKHHCCGADETPQPTARLLQPQHMSFHVMQLYDLEVRTLWCF
jgi:hypothetical protein